MNYFKVDNLSFKYKGSAQLVVKNFNMSMEKGEIVAFIGDSGCGKSTLLRLFTGLEVPNTGTIMLDNNTLFDCDKVDLPTQERNIGMIFQDYALFPHLTVVKNVAFALKGSRKDRLDEALSLLEMVKLKDHANKYPHQCSGGQQQRIAIARSLAAKPKLLLLDEPFSNLDSSLRIAVRTEVKELLKVHGMSAILVTHDREDVAEAADREVVIG